MDILSIIIYIVLFIIFVGAVGIIVYVGQDYFNYKTDSTYKIRSAINNNNDTNKKLVDTTIDLTDKINYSSSNMSNIMLSLNDDVSKNNIKIDTIKNDNISINSNISSFDANLKRYFNFFDGDNNIGTISETDNNNKIYNYLFSADDSKKLELINSTTAIAGMTINTTNDIDSFKICDGNNANNCINMKNNDGGFIISPSNENTSNIQFKKNIDSIPALNIDLQNSITYFNGNNTTESSMYVNESGVYVKNPITVLNVNFEGILARIKGFAKNAEFAKILAEKEKTKVDNIVNSSSLDNEEKKNEALNPLNQSIIASSVATVEAKKAEAEASSANEQNKVEPSQTPPISDDDLNRINTEKNNALNYATSANIAANQARDLYNGIPTE